VARALFHKLKRARTCLGVMSLAEGASSSDSRKKGFSSATCTFFSTWTDFRTLRIGTNSKAMESSSANTAVEEAGAKPVLRETGAKALEVPAAAATTTKDRAAFVNCILI